MCRYKKLSTCCGSTIKEGKTCDCPCLLIVDNIITLNRNMNDTTNNTAEVYNGRPVGLQGEVELTSESGVPMGVGIVIINFTSNGIVQPITLDLSTRNTNKIFSFLNVTKIEVNVMTGENLDIGVTCDGMTEPCKKGSIRYGSADEKVTQCNCPCQLLAEDIGTTNTGLNSMTDNLVEVYSGRAVGFHGEVVLREDQTDLVGVAEVIINFTSNGIIQPITLNLNEVDTTAHKMFSLLNVTKIDIMVLSGENLAVDIDIDGMTEPCS
ncbi:hypothetical protein [Cytobacillus sp. IB215665]|uniref:hypothetical protein n=1 Tax=Cytobacillus sp. IB215665 TaxID=3097357 RepID=UPI002A0CB7E6|nr:hypothetical protein [Cytobacillus sp. IB215665]MDX8367972.1 hypothetical protein [Cytobacillus sp. IB215665]